MRLHDLPDDILILVLTNCSISSLFALRLTSKPVYTVIVAYIETIAPGVAQTSFPDCTLLLKPPKTGYSFPWLKSLIPLHLAAIALDKDKLRRYPYLNAGFPYGIPSEERGEQAVYWRQRVANGWCVLRRLYLVSREVYAKGLEELGRQKMLGKMGGGIRKNRMWQSVACTYQACSEHGVGSWRMFEGKKSSGCNGGIEGKRKGSERRNEEIRVREAVVLKCRKELMLRMKDSDLMDYLYVWRLLLWVFRPYRKPETESESEGEGGNPPLGSHKPNWQATIADISSGCSWLTWFVLHVGTTPFWQQWVQWTCRNRSQPHIIRNLTWQAWSERSNHQIEIEREYISKFEFALRKRVLSSERLKRLENEIMEGRVVKTISLDCIPWEYDQNHIIYKLPSEFPWYRADSWVWMDGDVWVHVRGSQGRTRVMKSKENPNPEIKAEFDEFGLLGRGPLERVPYLVYLGAEDAESVWGGGGVGQFEMAF